MCARSISISFLLLSVFAFSQDKEQSFLWKNGAKAAICLTYDDGMQTHMDNAIPQLDSVGLKGTFFINTPLGTTTSVVNWIRAAKNGHELGNHSLLHPCPKSLGWAKEIATENYTLNQILDEVELVNQILERLNPSRSCRSYAYPCNNTFVGGKSYVKDLEKSGLISFARTGSEKKTIITNFGKELDKMNMPSWIVPDNARLEDLIDYAEKAKDQGGLAIFQFHGIGGQWLTVSNEVHRSFLEYLMANKGNFYVTPFSSVMEYINKHMR